MKRIAFVATREPGYSRVSITRRELRRRYELDEFVSEKKSYPLRLTILSLRLVVAWMSGRLRKADAVFVGFLAQPIFPLVRLLYRGPIISDAYFSLYDAMVNDKQKVSATSLVGRICYWLDRHMLKHSELCFTDTQQHVEYMSHFFEVPDANIRRLWISAESKPLAQIADLNTRPSFEVFFWGGFIPLQGVDTIVRAAALLRDDNVNFTIFGAGQTFESCGELQRELNVDNLNFAGWQQPDQISVQASGSHLALGIFGTTKKAGRVIPNKVYEGLAMGIPLITCRSKAIDELLTEDQHCMLVDPGCPEQLAGKILWARDHFEDAKAMAREGQQLFESTCSPRQTAKIMFHAIDELLESRVASDASRELAGQETITSVEPAQELA